MPQADTREHRNGVGGATAAPEPRQYRGRREPSGTTGWVAPTPVRLVHTYGFDALRARAPPAPLSGGGTSGGGHAPPQGASTGPGVSGSRPPGAPPRTG